MKNLSKIKRDKMIEFLEELKNDYYNDDEKIRKINEIHNALTEKKYGLVWEKHEERVDEMLKNNIPIFKEVEESKIRNIDKNEYNFLLEGDNLHSLKLLEKTHRRKIDVIYIDPPYNTGNKDFKYNDTFIDKTDGYSHSKWLSFMEERLKIARELLTDNGVIFISIDDNEQAQLKLLCDEIFGENNFESFIWKKKSGSGNTEKIVGCLTEYILCFFKNKKAGIFNYRIIDRTYKYEDEHGKYNLEGIEKTNLGTYRRETMIFPIINPITGHEFMPKKDMRWTLGKDTINKLIADNKIFFDDKKNKVYRKKREDDYEKSNNVYYNLLLDYGSLSTAKDEIKNILNSREIFSTPKPIKLIKHILEICSNKNSIILDFFAGSGTTGHAVIQLNKEDGGNRKYILCTNNENNICEEITYQRLKNIQNELPHNLKYFKTDFIIKRSENEHDLNIRKQMLNYIKQLIELEHMVDLDGVDNIIIDDEDKLLNILNTCKDKINIYIYSNILVSEKEKVLAEKKKIKIIEIPEYYFRDELKELGEV